MLNDCLEYTLYQEQFNWKTFAYLHASKLKAVPKQAVQQAVACFPMNS